MKKKMNIKYLPHKVWKEDKIEPIKKIKIGVIDGAVNDLLFDDYSEYKNFTTKVDNDINALHSALVCSIIKDIYPPSELYVAQVYCNDTESSTESIMRALNWLVEKKVDIINISLGFYNNCSGDCLWGIRFKKLQTDYGVIIVVAGGNSNSKYPNHTISCPGCSSNVITVGALNKECMVDKKINLIPLKTNNKPELYANGYITSVMNDNKSMEFQGSSFSSPIVAALIAKKYNIICPSVDMNQTISALQGIQNYLQTYIANTTNEHFVFLIDSLKKNYTLDKIDITNKNIVNILRTQIAHVDYKQENQQTKR